MRISAISDAPVLKRYRKDANTLAKAGGNLDDIVSMSVFLTDLRYAPQFQENEETTSQE
jgi:enamine deaminase RidA (YjgF/YER057c/UK114 family)